MPVRLASGRVRVPAPLAPLRLGGLWPGLVLLAAYGPGSTLEYREAAVLSPVRCGLRLGFHVHRIWVDDAASVRGGRQIWRLAKERGEFRHGAATAELRAAGGSLLRLRFRPLGPAFPLPPGVRVAVFVHTAAGPTRFRARVRGRVRSGRASLEGDLAAAGVAAPLPLPAWRIERLRALVLPPASV